MINVLLFTTYVYIAFITFKVDFNTNLRTPKERDDYKIELGADVLSGETNGLTVYLDVEEYDHGYLPAKDTVFFSILAF